MDNEKANLILMAARKVFFRYGYRRVTMGDIAEAAGISRPALYLVFPSKEEIFKEVISRMIAETLDEIRTGLPKLKTIADQLTFAFEVWAVRPHDLIHVAPDASDLLECSYEFASDLVRSAEIEFEGILVDVLKRTAIRQNAIPIPAARIARVLASSVHGMKKTAKTSIELRERIGDLLTITLASLRVKKRN